jgi:hypothetical protein
MTEREVEALLKKRGRPSQTAARYLPGRHLIGPTLFPMYAFALKLAGWIWLGVAVTLLVARSLIISDRPASFAHILFESFESSWDLALAWFAMITVGFAVAEYVQRRPGSARDWNPSRLPSVRDGLKVKRSSSIAEMLWSVLFLLAWLGAFPVADFIFPHGEPIQLAASPLWLDLRGPYFIPIVVLILADIALSAIDLARPQLSRGRVALRAADDALTAVLFGSLLIVHGEETRAALNGLKGLKDAAAGAAKLEILRDWGLALVLLFIAAGSAVSCVVRLVRLTRRRAWASRPAG